MSELNFQAEAGPMPDTAWIQEVEDGSVDSMGEIESVADAVDPSKQPEQGTPMRGENLIVTVFFTHDLTMPAVEAEAEREADGAAAGLEAEPEEDCAPSELEDESEADAAVEPFEPGRRSFSRRRPQLAGDESDWQFGEKIDNIQIRCVACRDLSHPRRHLTCCKGLTSCQQPEPINMQKRKRKQKMKKLSELGDC